MNISEMKRIRRFGYHKIHDADNLYGNQAKQSCGSFSTGSEIFSVNFSHLEKQHWQRKANDFVCILLFYISWRVTGEDGNKT